MSNQPNTERSLSEQLESLKSTRQEIINYAEDSTSSAFFVNGIDTKGPHLHFRFTWEDEDGYRGFLRDTLHLSEVTKLAREHDVSVSVKAHGDQLESYIEGILRELDLLEDNDAQ